MKKIMLTLALIAQIGFAMADNKVTVLVQARQNNVKMFQQAGTATQILENINTSDRVTFIRKFNTNWALVEVNGKTGYVLLTELVQLKEKVK